MLQFYEALLTSFGVFSDFHKASDLKIKSGSKIQKIRGVRISNPEKSLKAFKLLNCSSGTLTINDKIGGSQELQIIKKKDLKAGDVIKEINGVKVSKPMEVMKAYNGL